MSPFLVQLIICNPDTAANPCLKANDLSANKNHRKIIDYQDNEVICNKY
jgi:hypothetical protein